MLDSLVLDICSIVCWVREADLDWCNLVVIIQADQESVATEFLFPPVFRAEYAAKAREIWWLVRLRHTAARQRRIHYLDGWFGVVDRSVAAVRGYFRHPAF